MQNNDTKDIKNVIDDLTKFQKRWFLLYIQNSKVNTRFTNKKKSVM